MANTNHRLDIFRIRKPIDNGFSLFTWGVRNGYPRATVFVFKSIGDRKASLEHIIPANMDMSMFTIFMESTIKSIEDGKTGTFCKLECKRNVYENNRPTGKLETTGVLVSGFDNDGLFLSVVIPDKPKIKFYRPMSEYHALQLDGKETTSVDQNRFYGIGYLKSVYETVKTISAIQIERLSQVEDKLRTETSENKPDDSAIMDDIAF